MRQREKKEALQEESRLFGGKTVDGGGRRQGKETRRAVKFKTLFVELKRETE
jgi:hypothetical protein